MKQHWRRTDRGDVDMTLIHQAHRLFDVPMLATQRNARISDAQHLARRARFDGLAPRILAAQLLDKEGGKMMKVQIDVHGKFPPEYRFFTAEDTEGAEDFL